jgi:hypothetical protein
MEINLETRLPSKTTRKLFHTSRLSRGLFDVGDESELLQCEVHCDVMTMVRVMAQLKRNEPFLATSELVGAGVDITS